MTKTLPAEFTVQDDFPPVNYDDWRTLVDQALGGASFERKLVKRTYDGVNVQPIYGRHDELRGDDPLGFPGLAPFARGSRPLGAAQSGWDLRQEFAHPDLSRTNQAILNDLKGGVTSLHVRLDMAARRGIDPDHPDADELAGIDGVMAYSVDDLDKAFADVPLNRIPVAIDAGAAFLPAAAMLAGLWRRRDTASEEVLGAFHADPLASLARDGRLPLPAADALASMADLAKWTAENYPRVTAVGVDTAPYHDAGASAAQDIAFATATAVEYLRAMNGAGLDIDVAAQQIVFRIGLGTHHFQAIAKLRAARQVWARVIEASGGSGQSQAMKIHARTSNRVLTQYDPHVNLLRNAVAVFAAGVGGADAITSVPFDAMTGLPSEFSRRVARNTVLVLQEESHLHRVIDPAGGSWFLDRLTEDLASKAWEIFQESERQGGMLSALSAGWVAEQIEQAYLPRAKNIASRKEGITGVSEFPDVNQEQILQSQPDIAALRNDALVRVTGARNAADSVAVESIAGISDAVIAATKGATAGQIATAIGFHSGPNPSITAFQPHRFAEPFEKLREACDAWQASHGQRPRVFLANFGPLAHHTARAMWSKNFFEAGGFEVIGNDGFEDAEAAAKVFAESGAEIAVVCSSDKLYPDLVPQAAAKLREAGATSIVLAGHPGDSEQTWRADGVDRFIFLKCNVLETLRELLRELGVLKDGESK
jgi:methylmalonyl-CoA mutase